MSFPFGSRVSGSDERSRPFGSGRVLFLPLLFLCLGIFHGATAAQDAGSSTQAEGPGEAAGVGSDVGSVEFPLVHRVTLAGPARADAAELVDTLGQRAGTPLDPGAISRGIELLWEQHHVHAGVHQKALEVDGVPGVELLLVLREFPLDLEPRFVGNVDVDIDDIYKWTGLRPGQALYLDQANRVRDRLLRGLQSEGYYFAEVRVVERLGAIDEGTGRELAPDVIFEIREGPKVRVRDIVISGNESISNRSFLFLKRGLSKIAGMKLRGPRFFGLLRKAFVDETLQSDLIGLRTVYRDQGWLDAVVGVGPLEFSKDRSWVTIPVVVDEGERYAIESISIEGVEQVYNPDGGGQWETRPAELVFPLDELLELIKSRPGDFLERTGQGSDMVALRRHYGEFGYISHESLPKEDRWEFLVPELIFEKDRPGVHVVYRIAQGRQIFLREIRTQGNLHTHDRVIRDLISLDEGDVANPTEIERSRTRIQSPGWFSDPTNPMEHREPTYRFEDTSDPNWKDLVYVVEEGQVIRFNISGGVSSNTGAFGVISYTQQNFDIGALPRSFGSLIGDVASRQAFHGAGQQLTLQASPGTEVSFFDIRFHEPDILGRHRDRISGTISASRRRHLLRSHDEEREEFSLQFGRQITIDSSVFAGFGYETVDISDLDHGGEPNLGSPLNVPTLLKEQEGRSNLAYAEFGYRLRTLDNYYNPRNGVNFSWNNQFNTTALGSDYEFLKSDVRFDFYDEINEDEEGVSDRYHLGLRAAVATPFGDTDNVPYSERYHAGGNSTARGWRYRGVGPNEKGFPMGGETMLYATIDYRRPLVTTTQPGTYQEIESFQGGVFLDMVVLDPDAFHADLSELRASIGIAFGITVPLPITFSFGFPIKEGPGDRKQVFAFNIGF